MCSRSCVATGWKTRRENHLVIMFGSRTCPATSVSSCAPLAGTEGKNRGGKRLRTGGRMWESDGNEDGNTLNSLIAKTACSVVRVVPGRSSRRERNGEARETQLFLSTRWKLSTYFVRVSGQASVLINPSALPRCVREFSRVAKSSRLISSRRLSVSSRRFGEKNNNNNSSAICLG